MGTHPQRLRELSARKTVVEKYGMCCYYCGIDLTESTLTIDHLIPKTQQGDWYDPENLVPACQPCNCEKDGQTLEEYRLFVYRNSIPGQIAYHLQMALELAVHEKVSLLNQLQAKAVENVLLGFRYAHPEPLFAWELKQSRLHDLSKGSSELILMVNPRLPKGLRKRVSDSISDAV